MLVNNWRNLWKSWSVQFAALGLVLPEVLQFLADNTDSLFGLDAGWKSIIRMVCLIGVIVCRPLRQPALSDPPKGNP